MFGTVQMGGKIKHWRGKGNDAGTIFTLCGVYLFFIFLRVSYLFGVTFRLCQFDA